MILLRGQLNVVDYDQFSVVRYNIKHMKVNYVFGQYIFISVYINTHLYIK